MTSSKAAVIQAKRIQKTWLSDKSQSTLFKGLDFSIFEGEFVCLLGPSGCGKSTLLRILGDLDPHFEGEVIRAGQNSETQASLLPSFVFQEHRLLPWLTTEENIYLPLKIRNTKTWNEAQDSILKILLRLGMQKQDLKKFPHELSGGMKMRVAIARALIQESKLLLFDEPFSALDEPTRLSLQELVRGLLEQEGLSALMVTHSVSEAVFLSDRIQVLGRKGLAKNDFKIQFEVVRNSELRYQPKFQDFVKIISETLASETLAKND